MCHVLMKTNILNCVWNQFFQHILIFDSVKVFYNYGDNVWRTFPKVCEFTYQFHNSGKPEWTWVVVEVFTPSQQNPSLCERVSHWHISINAARYDSRLRDTNYKIFIFIKTWHISYIKPWINKYTLFNWRHNLFSRWHTVTKYRRKIIRLYQAVCYQLFCEHSIPKHYQQHGPISVYNFTRDYFNNLFRFLSSEVIWRVIVGLQFPRIIIYVHEYS